ncbi:putative serine protease K12H4.7 [Varroa jacobsoni]|uniref:Serine protease K12H4.7 n=1 Tax=Varroa destructor TaxID=109461 RepID=A0A7M7K6S1_VARDE|nr:putative serine protease K12H4.7 [Varroa destructor]XP_022692340.1 putative serine protease K12H4.7 [Varroa jacobsoni]
MHQMVIAFLVLLAFAGFGNAYKLHRGRPYHKYGMLGEPKFDNSTSFYGEPEILWITQRLDNFNPADRRTWKQRYMVNAKFYKTGGPVFLLLGGEGEASAKWLSAPSHVMIMAQKYGALVFQLEHRFYGKSRPTTDLTTSNLAYLSSDQALADAAAFRNSITVSKQLDQNARWVVFGGSYSGSLAAWFKLKYPHLAVGAVASSAPMVALINFVDYIRVVRDSLGPDCSTKVKAGFAHLEKLAARREKWAIIDGQFKTCVPFDAFNQLNMQNFFQTMAGLFEGVVQYNKDERISGPSNITIDTVCDLMMSNEPFDGLVAVNDLILQSNNETCLDYDYDKFVRSMRNVSYDARSGEGGRQWMYQTCVEFGFFQSSDAKDQPFGQQFPVQLFIQQCRDIFDDFFDNAMLNRAIFRTNTQYGGIYPQLSNVTFPNGSIDPWHTLSILENLSDSVTANYIVGTAHCADMYPPAATDANTLTQARTKIEHEVAKWLQQ